MLLLKNRQCLPFYQFMRKWKTYSRSIADRIKTPFWKGLPGPNLGIDLPYILGLCWSNHHCLPTLCVCVSPTHSSSIWYRNESPLFWALGFQLHTFGLNREKGYFLGCGDDHWFSHLLSGGLELLAAKLKDWFFPTVWPNLQQHPTCIYPKLYGRAIVIPGSVTWLFSILQPDCKTHS